MKITGCLLIFCLGTECNAATVPAPASIEATTECEFSLDHLNSCGYRSKNFEIEVQLETATIDKDELGLLALTVINNRKKFELPISADTSLLEGDMGFISFPDINFDSIPDLAITTSFGVANLYLDYWVYQPEQKNYFYVGNLPQLILDSSTRTITTRVKNNAGSYEESSLIWSNGSLIKR